MVCPLAQDKIKVLVPLLQKLYENQQPATNLHDYMLSIIIIYCDTINRMEKKNVWRLSLNLSRDFRACLYFFFQFGSIFIPCTTY